MIVHARLRAVGPYALARSAASPPCLTRSFRAGVLEMAFDGPTAPAVARVAQSPDGSLRAAVTSPDGDAAVDVLADLMGLRRDPAAFHARAAADPLLGPLAPTMRGVRPIALGSAAHGLLRGVCGQLVTTRDARRAERAGVRPHARRAGGLHVPLRTDELRRVAPVELVAGGLAARRAEALARAARALRLDALAGLDADALVRRICARPGLGPWTAGVLALEGLGRWDVGLVGDLGLMRVVAAMGREPVLEETADLLDRYAPWQGLASLWILGALPAARTAAAPAAIARAGRQRSRR